MHYSSAVHIMHDSFQTALLTSGATTVTGTALTHALPVAMESVAPVSLADGGLCVTRCVETTAYSVTTNRDVCNAHLADGGGIVLWCVKTTAYSVIRSRVV